MLTFTFLSYRYHILNTFIAALTLRKSLRQKNIEVANQNYDPIARLLWNNSQYYYFTEMARSNPVNFVLVHGKEKEIGYKSGHFKI